MNDVLAEAAQQMAEEMGLRAAVPPSKPEIGPYRPMLSARELGLLLKADYEGALSPATIVHSLSIDGVQATIVHDARTDTLGCLVRGTDERADWIRWNMRWWPSVECGDTRGWHRGFLQHGRIVYAWCKDRPISWMAGHSLGAAAVQIAGSSLSIPSVCIASPLPLYSGGQPDGSVYVVNYVRADDPVGYVPPALLGFEHVGRVVRLIPRMSMVSIKAHCLSSYLPMLPDGAP